jgi:single-strand DNA-binding protein
MVSMNNVQLLGKVTLEPRIRTLKSGAKVAEVGMGIPENKQKENGEWDNQMHFVDVVLWNDQATFAEKRLKKGDAALVQGMLQFDQWESKDGSKRNKLRVKGLRIQAIPLHEKKEQAS